MTGRIKNWLRIAYDCIALRFYVDPKRHSEMASFGFTFTYAVNFTSKYYYGIMLSM